MSKLVKVKLSPSLKRAIGDALLWAPFKYWPGDEPDEFKIEWRGRTYRLRFLVYREDQDN